MKNIFKIRNTVTFLSFSIFNIFMFSGCDMAGTCGEDWNGNSQTEERNVGIRISLYTEKAVQTKGSEDVENSISDINILVFGEDGNLIAHDYSETAQDIRMNLPENRELEICAVANFGSVINIKNKAELSELRYTASSAYDTGSDGMFLMSGGKTAVISEGSVITLGLRRCACKIIVKADISSLGEGCTLMFKELKLKNMPGSVFPFKVSAATAGNVFSEGIAAEEGFEEQLAGNGCVFYIFENMQGELLPGIKEQKEKVFPEGDARAERCSYLEITGEFISPEKSGEIIYRTYLGKDVLGNFDIERNCIYNTELVFTGYTPEEAGWRIDVSGLGDRVTSVNVTPSHSEIHLDEKIQLKAEIYPESAEIRDLVWSSSNERICTVDNNGMVHAKGTGKAIIRAEASDGSGKYGEAEITVTYAPVERVEIKWKNTSGTLFSGDANFVDRSLVSGQKSSITYYAEIYPYNADQGLTVEWEVLDVSGNPSAAKIVETLDGEGNPFVVKAVPFSNASASACRGKVRISASVNDSGQKVSSSSLLHVFEYAPLRPKWNGTTLADYNFSQKYKYYCSISFSSGLGLENEGYVFNGSQGDLFDIGMGFGMTNMSTGDSFPSDSGEAEELKKFLSITKGGGYNTKENLYIEIIR